MPKNEKIIYVYDSFTFDEPKLLGKLFVSTIKGGETYSFEYDKLKITVINVDNVQTRKILVTMAVDETSIEE